MYTSWSMCVFVGWVLLLSFSFILYGYWVDFSYFFIELTILLLRTLFKQLYNRLFDILRGRHVFHLESGKRVTQNTQTAEHNIDSNKLQTKTFFFRIIPQYVKVSRPEHDIQLNV